jgi:PAS domain S-box-containing protein
MGPASEQGGRAERHARWVAMWREAIRASTTAIGLVDLTEMRFIEVSQRAVELLGTTPEAAVGLSYLAVTERPGVAAEAFRMAREGIIDGIQGRRRFRRPDGSTVEMHAAGWAIRSRTGPDLGLWMAYEEAPNTAAEDDVVAAGPWLRTPRAPGGARITLDDRWRMAHGSTDAVSLLGRSPHELATSSILRLVHPDDLASALLAFAQATTGRVLGVRILTRQDDDVWRTVRAHPTFVDGDGSSPFVLAVAADDEGDAGNFGGGVSELARHLRRVAAQIEAAASLGPMAETAEALGIPATISLSGRQWEIASRLVGGDRVSTIAAEMHLSRSTVRNHLSAIFKKAGVHSQAELLARWRGAATSRTHRPEPVVD